jgi:serine/alanine adding enzyme
VSAVVERYAGDAGEWDGLVAKARGGTHAHRLGWLRVFEETFGLETIPLAVRGPAGRLEGVLPLVRQRSLLFGHYLTSVPFLNYGGPLGTPDAVRALAAEGVRLSRASGARLLELRSRVEQPLDLPVSRRKITVVLDLPESPEALWEQLPSKLRSQVRRPGKEGVVARSGADLILDFHRVFARHMRDLGTPALPLGFFQSLSRHVAGDAWFTVAYLGEEPVAAGAGVCWNGESEIIWASALRAHAPLAANMLVYWTAIQAAVSGGCRVFNFGRCSPGSGTHRFKLQWGGRDEPLWWYQDSPSGVSATPSPEGAGFRLAVEAWKRLPVPVATRVGGFLIRGIP